MNKLPFNLIKKDEDNNIGVIDIYGVIGESFWEQGYTKEQMLADLEVVKATKMSKLVLNINSLGGSVNDALSIYDMLVELNVPVVARLTGFVASAATVIASAADHIEMSENSFFLIHKAMTATMGNSNELESDINFLKMLDEKILNIYSKRVDRDVVSNLLEESNGNGKWITAEEALSYGFIDAITKKEEKEEEKEAVNSVEFKRLGLPEIIGVAKTPETKGFLQNLKDKIFGAKEEVEEPTIDETPAEEVIEDPAQIVDDNVVVEEPENAEEVEEEVEEPVLSMYEETELRITNLEKELNILKDNYKVISEKFDSIVNENKSLQAEKETLTNAIETMVEEKVTLEVRVKEMEDEPVSLPINLSPEGNTSVKKVETELSKKERAWANMADAKRYLGKK